MMKQTLILALTAIGAQAWAPIMSTPQTSTTALSATRQEFLQAALAGAAAVTFSPGMAFAEDSVTLPSGVSYVIKKAGDGPKPDVGELAAIRFAAYFNDFKLDDIFDTPEPYYTRVGSGGLLKGVEQVLPSMRVGDRWVLTIPVCDDGQNMMMYQSWRGM